MDQQTLQECFEGSRLLNQMKGEIDLFLAMFVRPFGDQAVELHGKFSSPVGIEVGPLQLMVATTKRAIEVTVSRNGEVRLLSSWGASALPLDWVYEVWTALPALYDELAKLVPAIKGAARFYQFIRHSRQTQVV